MIVSRCMRLLFTYIIHPYRPRVTLRAWRRLASFSIWSWALSMTALLQGRADTIVIGGYLNPTAVGLYSVGGEVGGLASSELLDPILRVLFAGFSSVRRSGDNVAAAYLRAISVVALVMLPTSAGIALIARPLMHLAFGPRWDAAVPLVQMFACIGVFRVGAYISSTLLMAEGVPHISVWIEVILTFLRIVSLVVLVPMFGVIGAAISLGITAGVEEIVYLVVTFRHTGLRWRDLAVNLWRPAAATGTMTLVLMAAGLTQTASVQDGVWTGLMLATTVLLGMFIYCAVIVLTWLASGRPRGAEAHVLAILVGPLWRRLRR